jgi:exodeoxyribonuclease V alpha subunit
MTDLASSLVPGLLLDAHATGALAWADVHVAQKVAFLYSEPDQRVQLALALAVRSLRAGSTCLELSQVGRARFDSDEESFAVPPELWPEPVGWREAIAASPLVTSGADGAGARPLRLVGDLLYLERYWQEESVVATQLNARRERPPAPVSRGALLAAGHELLRGVDTDQAVAAVVPALAGVTVVAGGPGTGKTHTLARLLGVLWRALPRPPLVALAAPTGKAAARMQEALSDAVGDLPSDVADDLRRLQAGTIHRLLGWLPESRSRFRHDAANPLPHDVVVIDEASMVNVSLMARLLEAMRPHARLVLVGDPDQLAPVEAGAVLADIVAAPAPAAEPLADALTALGLPPSGTVVRLRHNYRSVPGIAQLAADVLSGDPDVVLARLAAGIDGVEFAASVTQTDLPERIGATGAGLVRAAREGRQRDALAALDEHRLLCAHRRGPYGVALWSRQVEEWLGGALDDFDPTPPWYAGRPVLVTQNAPELGVYNGDTGVVVDVDGQLQVCFARGRGVHRVSPSLLDGVQTIHAMTVHKAQGSQFERVTVVLPTPDSPLLTQELLYTAITRAKREVTLIGSPESLAQAVRQRARRASGLRERL